MEITKKLSLSNLDTQYIRMHSVLNLLNVLTYEILQLSDALQDQSSLSPSLTAIQNLAAVLSNKEKTFEILTHIDESKNKILENIEMVGVPFLESSAIEQDRREKVEESIANLHSLMDVLELRAAEIVDRERQDEEWQMMDIDDLKKRFEEVFCAIEKNSKGRYSIVTREEEHNSFSYLICAEIDSPDGQNIYMPPEFEDTVRDLIANARKYSEPGGRITAKLSQSTTELLLRIEDNGKGIPEDQIESIIDYGFRGSNIKEKKSYGGGFGITKAYYITKRYGGRMWIDSALDEGTAITIKIPLPE